MCAQRAGLHGNRIRSSVFSRGTHPEFANHGSPALNRATGNIDTDDLIVFSLARRCKTLSINCIYTVQVVRSEPKLGVNLSNNLAKYEVFSFQPIGALEFRSMTSELKIKVSVLTLANE